MPRRTPTRSQASGHRDYQEEEHNFKHYPFKKVKQGRRQYQSKQKSACHFAHYPSEKAPAVNFKVHLQGVHHARPHRLRRRRLLRQPEGAGARATAAVPTAVVATGRST